MTQTRLLSQWLWLRCLLASILLACVGSAQAQAAAPGALERQVKAAYLYKFASFVEWPATSFARPDSPLYIGVSGSDLLAEQLERIAAGRLVNGRPIKVRRVQRGDALADLHILFLDASLERGAMSDMLLAARGQPLLTVSDTPDPAALGCMIGFLIAEDKLRFDVALNNVTPSGLRISARMLAVAHKVRGAS